MGLRGVGARRTRPTKNELPTGMHGGIYRRRAAEAEAALPKPAEHTAGFYEHLWGRLESGSAFADLDEMRADWALRRDEMTRPGCFGTGYGKWPWSFWHFDQPPPPDCETESECVWAHVPTTQAEIDAIERMWLAATQAALNRYPRDRDRKAARAMALTDGDCPSWAFDALIAEGMARPPSAVVPIAPRRRKRRRRA